MSAEITEDITEKIRNLIGRYKNQCEYFFWEERKQEFRLARNSRQMEKQNYYILISIQKHLIKLVESGFFSIKLLARLNEFDFFKVRIFIKDDNGLWRIE